jgi:ureidoglycolate lyase
MRTLAAGPIDPEVYAPYGSVVSSRGHDVARIANHGAAIAWDGLATLVDARGSSASIKASLFRCKPLDGASIELRRLERHTHSTQMFVPMNAARYLVIVALGGDAPDFSTLAAFVVGASQAITYAAGTWHHPMIALDRETDFVNVVGAAGDDGDCDERNFDPPTVRVDVPSSGDAA